MSDPAKVNLVGFDYWNSDAGRQWVTQQELIDSFLVPVTNATISVARPQPGERIVDVGCGTGATVFQLADCVGPSGHVTGIDISAPMLDWARQRLKADRRANVSFVEADATSHAFAPASVDLMFSRFGVMFFDDPVKAFANMRTALKPGGRMVFVCFRAMPESSWFHLPIEAARPHLPALPPVDPEAPGGHTFAHRARLEGILSQAGYHDVTMTARDVPVGAGSVEHALMYHTRVGPIARLMNAGSVEQRAQAEAAMRKALEGNIGTDGNALTLGVWMVGARA